MILTQSILEVCKFNGKTHEARKQCAILPDNNSTDHNSEAPAKYSLLITAAMDFAKVSTNMHVLSQHLRAHMCMHTHYRNESTLVIITFADNSVTDCQH
jgi:hypothetical protein